MDVLYIMKSEHETILSSLKAFESATAVAEKRQLFDQLESTLGVHLRLEESYLYPELAGLFPGAEVLVDMGLVGHSLITKHLAAIDKLLSRPAAEQSAMPKKEELLRELIAKHIESQEQMLMPKIRQLIPTGAREDLGQVLLDAKEEFELSPASAAAEQAASKVRGSKQRRA